MFQRLCRLCLTGEKKGKPEVGIGLVSPILNCFQIVELCLIEIFSLIHYHRQAVMDAGMMGLDL